MDRIYGVGFPVKHDSPEAVSLILTRLEDERDSLRYLRDDSLSCITDIDNLDVKYHISMAAAYLQSAIDSFYKIINNPIPTISSRAEEPIKDNTYDFQVNGLSLRSKDRILTGKSLVNIYIVISESDRNTPENSDLYDDSRPDQVVKLNNSIDLEQSNSFTFRRRIDRR